jgi:hypothetical protein
MKPQTCAEFDARPQNNSLGAESKCILAETPRSRAIRLEASEIFHQWKNNSNREPIFDGQT